MRKHWGNGLTGWLVWRCRVLMLEGRGGMVVYCCCHLLEVSLLLPVPAPAPASLALPYWPPPHRPLQDLVEGFRSCVWVPLPEGWEEHHEPRSKRNYYVNSATGGKQWDRPQIACALVQGSESSHQQPSSLQPRRSIDSDSVPPVPA